MLAHICDYLSGQSPGGGVLCIFSFKLFGFMDKLPSRKSVRIYTSIQQSLTAKLSFLWLVFLSFSLNLQQNCLSELVSVGSDHFVSED